MCSCLTIEVKLGVKNVTLISRLRVVNSGFVEILSKFKERIFPSIK